MTVVTTGQVTVRYYAAAAAAAGVEEETIEVGSGSTIQQVLDESRRRHGSALGTVLYRCSFLLDEIAVHGFTTTVTAGQSIDVLPPFAGG